MAPNLPADVLRLVIDGVCHKRFGELHLLYAPETEVTHPFGSTEVLRGRAALREHFARAAALPVEMRVEDLVLHTTVDPEVVIGEFVYRGRHTGTGRRFAVGNVFVMRVRDGLIVSSRDYADHTAFAAALAA